MFALYQLMERLYETIELVQAGRYAESRAKLARRSWMHEEWARALPAGIRDDLHRLYDDVVRALSGRTPDHCAASDGCERIRTYLHRIDALSGVSTGRSEAIDRYVHPVG